MTDEEKKAWDRLIMMKEFIVYDSDDDYENHQAIQDIEAIDTILNLIEKQDNIIKAMAKELTNLLEATEEEIIDKFTKGVG